MAAFQRAHAKAMMDFGSTLAHPAANGQGTDSISRPYVPFHKPDSNPAFDLYDHYRRIDYQDEKGLFWALLVIAVILTLLSALISGLILAISPLDVAWLNVMSATGEEKRRRRAIRVAQIRRRGTWFLTSMIIMSVLLTSAIPYIIQALFGMSWLVILISVLATIFVIELLPQYLMLRQPLAIASVLWPFIWGIMWVTSPISYPIAWCLDRLVLPKPERDMYNQEELSQLIKLHERREKHGGNIGPDPGRIMRGALELDGRTMVGPYASGALQDGSVRREKMWDVEIANSGTANVIVQWSSVKYVMIDEEVDEAFVRKLRGWAYSRYPVLDDGDAAGTKSEWSEFDTWRGKRIFGFLHIKNLLGLDLPSNNPLRRKLLVRDLPLYPLPIVRDDLPIFDLLNMFQLGMSRIAVITEAPQPRDSKDWMKSVEDTGTVVKKPGISENGEPLWTASNGLRTRASIDATADKRVDWTADLIEAAQKGVEGEDNKLSIKVGIGCPQPLGIVTFEDIIDTLMQKTSRDEKDFFDRKTFNPPTKRRKEGDSGSVRSTKVVYRSKRAMPVFIDVMRNSAEAAGAGSLRRRNVSGMSGTKGGPSEKGKAFGMDGQDDYQHELNHLRNVTVSDASSYTQNSQGGFHEQTSSTETEMSGVPHRQISVDHRLRKQKGRSNLAPSSHGTRPSMEASREFAELGVAPINPRKVSVDTTPIIGRMYGVPKTSREVFSSSEVPMCSVSEDISDAMPISTTDPIAIAAREVLEAEARRRSSGLRNPSDFEIVSSASEKDVSALYSPPSTGTVAPDSEKENTDASQDTAADQKKDDPSPLIAPRALKPPPAPRKPQHITTLTTLPRTILRGGPRMRNFTSQGIKLREESFHDDRSLLPSQRKGKMSEAHAEKSKKKENSAEVQKPARSSSFWV